MTKYEIADKALKELKIKYNGRMNIPESEMDLWHKTYKVDIIDMIAHLKPAPSCFTFKVK